MKRESGVNPELYPQLYFLKLIITHATVGLANDGKAMIKGDESEDLPTIWMNELREQSFGNQSIDFCI